MGFLQWRFVVLLVILHKPTTSNALITRRSKFDSQLKFTFPWKCRDPTPQEAAAMEQAGNPTFGVSSSFDPIGTSNGCMPDATCVKGVSAWTNVFG